MLIYQGQHMNRPNSIYCHHVHCMYSAIWCVKIAPSLHHSKCLFDLHQLLSRKLLIDQSLVYIQEDLTHDRTFVYGPLTWVIHRGMQMKKLPQHIPPKNLFFNQGVKKPYLPLMQSTIKMHKFHRRGINELHTPTSMCKPLPKRVSFSS